MVERLPPRGAASNRRVGFTRTLFLASALALGACGTESSNEENPSDPLSATGGRGGGPSGDPPASSGAGGEGARSGSAATGGSGAEASGGVSNPGTGGVSAAGGVPVAPGTRLSIPYRGQVLGAEALAAQLVAYDPGSLLRCDVADDPNYQTAIDELGGVTWGYNVGALEDQSKPRYFAGVEKVPLQVPGAPTAAGGDRTAVEIVTPDIVAVTEAAALFYSTNHGVMIVGVEGDRPEFRCAAQLPGRVDQFFFHQGHLVVMTKAQNNRSSHLLHFSVEGTELRFVESVNLGDVQVLDSRRFDQKLVFYTSFMPEQPSGAPGVTPSGLPSGPIVPAPVPQAPATQNHRTLRVFELGATLTEELHDTLIDTTASEAQLFNTGIPRDTAPGTQVSEARSFGHSMWASDHYFVVTEQISKTYVDAWATNDYSVCTASHVVEAPYTYCWTEYETRPNPDYTEPDNSGGDRACMGTTLSDCLIHVARVSNKTIQVPVGRKCEERVHSKWYCDAYEQRSVDYPVFRHDTSTRLYIYEYTEDGFVRVDSKVHEVTNSDLGAADPNSQVEVITTSAESYELAVPGQVQTLYFQSGYLYVISKGVLQVYAMGGSSIVRTATLPVVNETLQASLFAADRLYLSDFGWSGGDHSTLRVVGLANPAFPTLDGATHRLPGGHRTIIAADAGIFTIGSVQTFMGQSINALKLGLFSDPYAAETAYLILGTDLDGAWLGPEEAQFFNGASQRLLLPYVGRDEQGMMRQRVGVSRVVPGSIVSEGAVLLPEPAQRVRPLKQAEESYLTFATNSIEWLTPELDEWKSEPVLEYFEPFALYKRTEVVELVELQRLGTRCRMFFTEADAINQRSDGTYSQEFSCQGYPVAYERRFLFGSAGVEFGDDHSVRELTADEVKETTQQIAAREYCLLSLELVDNIVLDPNDLPPVDEFTCMSPEEYYDLRSRLQTATP
jgi:hypothetical protein